MMSTMRLSNSIRRRDDDALFALIDIVNNVSRIVEFFAKNEKRKKSLLFDRNIDECQNANSHRAQNERSHVLLKSKCTNDAHLILNDR